VKYKIGFYIPEDGILHSHRRENLKTYTSSVVIRPLNTIGKIHVTQKASQINYQEFRNKKLFKCLNETDVMEA
jgi:adenylyl- and sulfurtransferase ThiI